MAKKFSLHQPGSRCHSFGLRPMSLPPISVCDEPVRETWTHVRRSVTCTTPGSRLEAIGKQAAVLEHLQHRCVVRQNLRDELVKARVTGDRGQMAQQHGAETPALKLV